jgi:cell division septation protein DedD
MRRCLYCAITILVGALVWVGCTSAETGASNRAGDPQREMVVPTVTDPVPTTAAPRETTVVAPRRTRTVPRVRSSQDTVRAATARKTRPTVKPAPLVKPANALYTVQVGAFRQASNALRLQRAVKKTFSDQPVYNDYYAVDKLYRVTVGKFAKRSEAASLRRRVIAADSSAYALCWVTYKKP